MTDKVSILFLDNDKSRWETFSRGLYQLNHFIDLVWCNTAKKAIKRLDEQFWDIICLDHDLRGVGYNDSTEPNTGYQVAKAINDDVRYNNEIVFIHSRNHVGAMNIARLLSRSVYIPFDNYYSITVGDYARMIRNRKN